MKCYRCCERELYWVYWGHKQRSPSGYLRKGFIQVETAVSCLPRCFRVAETPWIHKVAQENSSLESNVNNRTDEKQLTEFWKLQVVGMIMWWRWSEIRWFLCCRKQGDIKKYEERKIWLDLNFRKITGDSMEYGLEWYETGGRETSCTQLGRKRTGKKKLRRWSLWELVTDWV